MDNKLQQVKAQFIAGGISIAEWARANSFSAKLVYRVLDGTVQGSRGKAHTIACKLGLKGNPEDCRLRRQIGAA
jgi:gp16 family phage-associated protein